MATSGSLGSAPPSYRPTSQGQPAAGARGRIFDVEATGQEQPNRSFLFSAHLIEPRRRDSGTPPRPEPLPGENLEIFGLILGAALRS
jgi:hypothetical protein